MQIEPKNQKLGEGQVDAGVAFEPKKAQEIKLLLGDSSKLQNVTMKGFSYYGFTISNSQESFSVPFKDCLKLKADQEPNLSGLIDGDSSAVGSLCRFVDKQSQEYSQLQLQQDLRTNLNAIWKVLNSLNNVVLTQKKKWVKMFFNLAVLSPQKIKKYASGLTAQKIKQLMNVLTGWSANCLVSGFLVKINQNLKESLQKEKAGGQSKAAIKMVVPCQKCVTAGSVPVKQPLLNKEIYNLCMQCQKKHYVKVLYAQKLFYGFYNKIQNKQVAQFKLDQFVHLSQQQRKKCLDLISKIIYKQEKAVPDMTAMAQMFLFGGMMQVLHISHFDRGQLKAPLIYYTKSATNGAISIFTHLTACQSPFRGHQTEAIYKLVWEQYAGKFVSPAIKYAESSSKKKPKEQTLSHVASYQRSTEFIDFVQWLMGDVKIPGLRIASNQAEKPQQVKRMVLAWQ